MASGNFRADHVGSLLPGLRRDGGDDADAVIAAVELQRESVVDVFSDGEPWRGLDAASRERQFAVRFGESGLAEAERLRALAPSWARLKVTLPLPNADGHDLVRDQAKRLLAWGLDYLQFDARHYSGMLDRERLSRDRAMLAELDVPDGATTAIYLGEGAGAVLAGLGSELLEDLFTLPVERFLIGIGAPSDGEMAFLAQMPEERFAVLGLFDAGVPALEEPDAVLGRIDAAAAIHGERLAICPSRGFADQRGNPAVTLHVQRAKLELVSDVARMFWGTEL
jgi:methionine synthase II (cobalamin-independent)